MSTAPSSEVEGSEEAANKSYIRNSTSYGSSGSTTSAEVCSWQSEWQTKEEQIKALQEKAVEAQWQPWLWRINEPNTRCAMEYGQHGHDPQTISTGQARMGQEWWDHSPFEGEWTYLVKVKSHHAYDFGSKILVHVRYVCIAPFIMSYLIHALHSAWGTSYFIPHIFSFYLEKHLQIYIFFMTVKARRGLLFYLSISKPLSMRTGLALLYMLGIDVISFSISMSLLFFCLIFQQKKNWGRRCGIFIFFFLLIAFQILHVFLLDISVHCALIKYVYIWLRVYAWYLLSFHVAS
jgi:hypothetical protein